MKQKQLDTIRRRISNVGTQPPELKPFNVSSAVAVEDIVPSPNRTDGIV